MKSPRGQWVNEGMGVLVSSESGLSSIFEIAKLYSVSWYTRVYFTDNCFQRNSNLMEICFTVTICCYPIAKKFCTCYGNTVFVSHSKACYYWLTRFEMRERWNFHIILILLDKSFIKCVLGLCYNKVQPTDMSLQSRFITNIFVIYCILDPSTGYEFMTTRIVHFWLPCREAYNKPPGNPFTNRNNLNPSIDK